MASTCSLREKLVKLDIEDGRSWLECTEVTTQNMQEKGSCIESSKQVMQLRFEVTCPTGRQIDPIAHATVNVILAILHYRPQSRQAKAYFRTSGFGGTGVIIAFDCSDFFDGTLENKTRDEAKNRALLQLEGEHGRFRGQVLAIGECIEVISRNVEALGFM